MKKIEALSSFEDSIFRSVKWFYWVILIFLIVSIFVFGLTPGMGPDLAEFGDFFGGVAGAIISLFALVVLMVGINIQRKELLDSRKELERSAKAIEDQAMSTANHLDGFIFFNLLKIFSDAADGLRSADSSALMGRGFIFDIVRNKNMADIRYMGLEDLRFSEKYAKFVEGRYEIFWKKNGKYISHYCRMVNAILDNLDRLGRKDYLHTFLSCLSDIELELFFYRFLWGKDRSFNELVMRMSVFSELTERPGLNMQIDVAVTWKHLSSVGDFVAA